MKKDPIPVLTIGNEPGDLPLAVHSLQWMELHREEVTFQPHRHDYFIMIYVAAGGGMHMVDLEEYQIHPDTVHFLAPGKPHLFRPSPDIEGLLVSFTSDFFCVSESNRSLLYDTGLFFQPNGYRPYQIGPADTDDLRWIFTRIEDEARNNESYAGEVIRGLLKMVLIKGFRSQASAPEAGAGATKRTQAVWQKFLDLLEANFMRYRQVSDYARMLVLTPNYLNEAVKKATGKPASSHIKDRVMLEAKRYAYYTDATVKEIGDKLGFDDESHFSRFFKNETGMSFSQFRKRQNTLNQ